MNINQKEISEILDKKVHLTPVNSRALTYWEEEWEKLSSRNPPDGGWNWRTHFLSQKKSITRRYSLAVWHEEILQIYYHFGCVSSLFLLLFTKQRSIDYP